MALTGSAAAPASPIPLSPGPGNFAPKKLPPAPRLRAVDCDHQTVVLNRPGMISLVLGTGADSQEAARRAGKAVYVFQGRPDFQLAVVVDLRDSIAFLAQAWVEEKIRVSLDREAIELKPAFLRNGNPANPRRSSHAIADFTGTICPQLGWSQSSDELRAILFGPDGRELKRWASLRDMDQLLLEVRKALETYAPLLDKAKR